MQKIKRIKEMNSMSAECDISLCKSNVIELGRLLAELQTKTINEEQQSAVSRYTGVRIEELNELKDSTNNFIFSCKIQDKGANEIRTEYRRILDAQTLAGSEKISDFQKYDWIDKLKYIKDIKYKLNDM